MLHRDFLMRQLHQAIQVIMQALARVMHLKTEGEYEQALGEIRLAFDGLDLTPRPVGELSADEIIDMCRTTRGFEADLALSIADLLREEGEILLLKGSGVSPSDEGTPPPGTADRSDGEATAAVDALEKALTLYRRALGEGGAVLPHDVGRRMDDLEALLARAQERN